MSSKKFDCVKMKDTIQRQILAELKGLSVEEQRRCTEEMIRSDPVLSEIWEHVPRSGRGRQPSRKAMETG